MQVNTVLGADPESAPRGTPESWGIDFKPPFVYTVLGYCTVTAGKLLEALEKNNISLIPEKYSGIPRDYLRIARATYKLIMDNLDKIDYIVFHASGMTCPYYDADFADEMEINGKKVRIFTGTGVKKLTDGVFAVFSIKCYSRAVGCKTVTDILFIDGKSRNWRRVWKHIETYEDLLKIIAPSKVLNAIKNGIKVPRQGDIWLVPVKPPRTTKKSKVVELGKATLFDSHQLTADKILVYTPENPDQNYLSVKRVVALNPRLRHNEHGELEAKGWYEITWNRRRENIILEKDTGRIYSFSKLD